MLQFESPNAFSVTENEIRILDNSADRNMYQIKPEFVGNGLLLRWKVTIRNNQETYCKTLEEALSLIPNSKE